jgi:hypothetical protein
MAPLNTGGTKMSIVILDNTYNVNQIEDLEFYVQMAFDSTGPALLKEYGEAACMKATFRVRIEVDIDADE